MVGPTTRKAYKLVVSDLCRKIRLALGGANRRKCQPGRGLQSACNTQGLCGNLIIALKLLANQQEDGDGLTRNIVTNLCEVSRKGLTDGLRKFMQDGNHRAPEVGHLSVGLGSFTARRTQGQEGHPEVTVR